MTERLLFENAFVVSMDPRDRRRPRVRHPGRGREDRRRRSGTRGLRGGARGLRGLHRDPGIRGHSQAHLADERPWPPAALHARRVPRHDARQCRHAVPARGRLPRQPPRLPGGAQRRHHDAPRLVARLQHARALRRGRARAAGRGHQGRLRARRPRRRRLVAPQRASAPGRCAAHPLGVLLERRPAPDLRARSARTREHRRSRSPGATGPSRASSVLGSAFTPATGSRTSTRVTSPISTSSTCSARTSRSSIARTAAAPSST